MISRIRRSNFKVTQDCLETLQRYNSKMADSAILKIVISPPPYLSKKSSDFDEILYTAAHFELDERHVIKNEKVSLDRLRVRQNAFLV